MIYVISPFWHEDADVREKRRAINISYADMLIKRGEMVFSPLKYSEKNINSNSASSESYWLDFDIEIMRGCDTAHVLQIDGWKESKGVANEIDWAKKNNMEIKYITHVNRVSIMGSRTLTEKQCNVALKDAIAKLTPRITIIPAEPEGACEFARKFVVKNGITSMLICKQKHRGAGMYEARTELVLKESDCCVFLHDGTSKGTRNEIEMCIKMGIPYLYYLLDGDKMVLSEYSTKGISDNVAENMGEDIPSLNIEIENLFNL